MKISKLKIFSGLFLGCLLMFVACKSDPKQSETKTKDAPKPKIDSIGADPIRQEIEFNLVATADTAEWLRRLTGDSLRAVLILNRVDSGHLFNHDTIILPKKFANNIDAYCPFPAQVDSLAELEKLICVSRNAQIYAVYEKGKRIKWGPTSTGKEATQTPTGLFSTNWKSKRNISSVNSSWILNWCFNISNGDGVSLHEYSLPGYPASHSCIRLYAEDAEWFYYWADQWILKENLSVLAFGTPVVIFDDYPFAEMKPWWRLVKDPHALDISQEQLTNAVKEHYELIYARQKNRIWHLEKRAEAEKEIGKVP